MANVLSLENASTSALGRCLAAFGLSGSEFASAEELVNALNNHLFIIHIFFWDNYYHLSKPFLKIFICSITVCKVGKH